MTTEMILEALVKMDEAPWGDLYGKPLNARGLAQRLHKYEIPRTRTVRVGEQLSKGYTRSDLWDAWDRYLSPVPPISHDSYPQGGKDTWDTNDTDSRFTDVRIDGFDHDNPFENGGRP